MVISSNISKLEKPERCAVSPITSAGLTVTTGTLPATASVIEVGAIPAAIAAASTVGSSMRITLDAVLIKVATFVAPGPSVAPV
ncbi:unannotated protein [freshwater metagenome]|uniref:Unannotated protein n=1 Tax=freshwater metagenome TaxID=449393 RepID=A0A6J6MXS4_9ZZZZ